MLPSIDAFSGEKYKIEHEGEQFVATFVKFKPDGSLAFERHDLRRRWYCPRKDFIRKRAKGFAQRINGGNEKAVVAIEPGALEPDNEADTATDRRRKRKYRKAVVQQHYIILIDKLGLPRSIPKLTQFIKKYAPQHKKQFGEAERQPGASTLITLYRTCGSPGHRPLHLFVSESGGDHRSSKWHKIILDLKAKMLTDYYRPNGPHNRLVRATFRDEAFKARANLAVLGEASFKIPPMSLLKIWLDMGGTPENVARREGRKIAANQFESIHPHVDTIRPLECVILDHTQIDMFVVVQNDAGEIIEICRPYLVTVIDVFSRMVLAANLSLKPPSLESLMTGIKETLVPKDWLEAQYGFLRGATDGWGMFYLMLVDNGLENIGTSLQSLGQAVGLDILFAPVKTPEYKSIGERFFQTLNTSVWHPAKGGIPHKPDVMRLLGLDPSKDAIHTLERAQDMLWNWIVTNYHLRKHSELGMSPTRSWLISGKEYTRPFVDDMNLIESVFGKRYRRRLTTAGIVFENEYFFDADLVEELIADLYYKNKRKKDARGKKRSISIEVEIIATENASFIITYNPRRRSYIRLPNVAGDNVGTFKQREAQRRGEDALNEAHYPEEQLAANEARHFRLISGATNFEGDPFVYDDESPHERELAPGIVERRAPSSHHGMTRAISSPHAPAIHERGDNQPMRTGVARGGRAGRKMGKNPDKRTGDTKSAVKTSNRKGSANKAVSQQAVAQITAVDIREVAENIANLKPKNPFSIEDREAFQANHEAELRRRMGR